MSGVAKPVVGVIGNAHLVENRVPLLGLMLVSILTATALALIFFWYVLTFIGLILLANTLPWLAVGVSGYRLTADGVRYRSRWIAFGRYLAAQGSLRDVGPGGCRSGDRTSSTACCWGRATRRRARCHPRWGVTRCPTSSCASTRPGPERA